MIKHPYPKFRADCVLTILKGSEKQTVTYTYTGEVPKELMDAYKQVLGNAAAKVSVSADMGAKEFGNGASATVFVTLSCDQNQETILQAIELAGAMARWAVKEQLNKTEGEFKQLQAAKGSQSGSPNYG
jgi:hypothetical protein